MKKILLFHFCLFISVCFAQTYTMNVLMKDGTTKTYSINDINNIRFVNVTSIKDWEKVQPIMSSFQLLQNYPNPFNPSTSIEYQLPKSGNVEVNIFDINGRLVKSIEPSFKNEGIYRVVWSGKNNSEQAVASGTYFYQVKFNNTVITKKMLLIK